MLPPVSYAPTAAPNAPVSRMPSSAMLITPERSDSTPPIAASAYGMVMRRTCETKDSESRLMSSSDMAALSVGPGDGKSRRVGLERSPAVRRRHRDGDDDDGLEDHCLLYTSDAADER